MPEKNRFPAVLQPIVIDRAAFNQGESEVMDSLVARGPHAVGIPPLMFKIRGGSPVETGEQGGTPGKAAGKGYLGQEDKAFTIATTQDQWLAAPTPFRKSKRAQSTTDDESWVEGEVSNTLNNFDLGDTRTTHAIVEPPMAVRRLTPIECERLQGFPDNWSRISWKGKPEEQCPDGPRYKACGNSMAVPVMRWIGERIAAVDSTISPNA
jgi:site-specific DNA-cytosine methylase